MLAAASERGARSRCGAALAFPFPAALQRAAFPHSIAGFMWEQQLLFSHPLHTLSCKKQLCLTLYAIGTNAG